MNGAELWAKRIALGLTPTRLSELIGPNKRNITRWEQREGEVPGWVADAVNDLYDQRAQLVRLIWEEHVDEDGNLDTLILVNRDEDVPSYAPPETSTTAWNNAVVAVLNEAEESSPRPPSVEWHRYVE